MKTQDNFAQIHQGLDSGRLAEFKRHDIVEEIHRERYRMAGAYTTKKSVLDIATGIGYGAHYLATSGGASSVVGVDISDEAIMVAKNKYREPNLSFNTVPADSLPFEDGAFETVVSFETIEHAVDQRLFLFELKRVLRTNGTLIISTPNKRFHSWGKSQPWNPYHAIEFYPDAFLALVSSVFRKPVFWGGQEFLPTSWKTVIRRNWVEFQYYALRHHPTRKRFFERLVQWKDRIHRPETTHEEQEPPENQIPRVEFERRCRVVPWVDRLEPYTMVAVCNKE